MSEPARELELVDEYKRDPVGLPVSEIRFLHQVEHPSGRKQCSGLSTHPKVHERCVALEVFDTYVLAIYVDHEKNEREYVYPLTNVLFARV